jgi:hypothetical protein
MVLKKGELRIFYRCEDEVKMLDSDLDLTLIETLKREFYYECWASGTDLTTGVRELAFEKKGGGDG